MTKLTVLHFASPFSVSMPVATTARGARGTLTAGRENTASAAETPVDGEAAPLLGGADSVSWLAMDAPVEPVQVFGNATGLLDKVRRRYAEHTDTSDDDEGEPPT